MLTFLVLRFDARLSNTTGKNRNKRGIKLSLKVGDAGKLGLSQDYVRSMFKDVGKDLDNDLRVEVEILD